MCRSTCARLIQWIGTRNSDLERREPSTQGTGHTYACQKENQRLERMNTLMERLLRRERQKNGYLLNRCAGQEGMLSSFRKDLPSVQNGMSSLLETWEDIGYTRAKQ
ncbi:hypothetical protein N7478_012336 [Penicillium angulare]|uniref:uncharacterized protein n=1 Tax=Penicillium angulare TaxID=116970 RepID=UPI002540D445|nr:uncharacterized protein N7478_012336 [Penicillium angulare]KAJ5259355.1 hypothetical protein N7478_012336 [Penicillium angulare]